jgi:hypothetical protein
VEYPSGREYQSLEFRAPEAGLGMDRNTPGFRGFLDIAQAALDAGDPINYAPHWISDPLEGYELKHVLVQADLGDMTVPTATGVALARAAGLISDRRMWRLVDLGVIEGREYLSYYDANVPEESKFNCGFRRQSCIFILAVNVHALPGSIHIRLQGANGRFFHNRRFNY